MQGDLTVNDINITAGMIGRVNIVDLLENAVLNHQDSVIYGLKTFQTLEGGSIVYRDDRPGEHCGPVGKRCAKLLGLRHLWVENISVS